MDTNDEMKCVYYVVLRGFNQRVVFKDEEGYEQFLSIFNKYKSCFMVSCHGYCLLPSGFYGVVEGKTRKAVEEIFKQTARCFAVYLCAREGRGSPVWEPTLEVACLDTPEKFKQCLSLLLSLPVWSGFAVSPSEYPYVSIG